MYFYNKACISKFSETFFSLLTHKVCNMDINVHGIFSHMQVFEKNTVIYSKLLLVSTCYTQI